MNRADLQRLAEDRILDAQNLLKAKRWSGAYYLAGYAVECGLKACILAHIERTGVIFEDRKYAERCWTHDLEDLVQLAALKEALAQDRLRNALLRRHWAVVKDWSEASRYRRVPHHKAKQMVKAISDKTNGVLPWIRNRW